MNLFSKKFSVIILSLLLFFGCSRSLENQIDDPDVIQGVLDNGFSYYVYENEKPENHVSIRLAVNVGSIHEADDQRGVAHFTEHMAFNGSKNFDGNELIEFLESTGVDYGPDLNAYTSFDETVYKLEIPLDNPENLETALTVIEDWAFGLTMADDQIDKERGIILQERRDRLSAWSRFQEEYFELLFNDSVYSSRFPIGTPEVIQNITYERFKEFYYDWYTPERMALVVVGTVNAKKVERQIKKQFSSYARNPESKKIDKSIEPKKGTEFLYRYDKEFEHQGIWFLNRITLAQFDSREEAIRSNYIRSLAASTIAARFDEKLNIGAKGVSSAYQSQIEWNKENSFYLTGLEFKQEDIEAGILSFLTEVALLRNEGATASELEQVKATALNAIQISFDERNNRTSQSISENFTHNYLNKLPIPNFYWLKRVATTSVSEITLEEVNEAISALLKSDNRVCTLFAPDSLKKKTPTEKALLALIDEAETNAIELAEKRKGEEETLAELEVSLPKPGKIVSKEVIKELKTTKYTLSNAVTVYYRQSDLTNNQLFFQGWSEGGTSLASDSDFPSAELADDLVADGPLANLSRTQKSNWLKRKALTTSLSIDELSHSITASTSTDHLKETFDWIYAQFLPQTANKELFEEIKSRYISYVTNLGNDPQTLYFRLLNETLRNKGDRNPEMLAHVAERAKFETCIEFYNERFSDATNFSFIFTGNIPTAEFEEFLASHMATLPSDNNPNNKETYKTTVPPYPSADTDMTYVQGTEEQAILYSVFTGEQKYSSRDKILFATTCDILSRLLEKEIREKESGAYSIGAFNRINLAPYEDMMTAISFSCDPARIKELRTKQEALLEEFVTGEFDHQLLENSKKIKLLQIEKNKQSDLWWLQMISDYNLHRISLDEFLSFEKDIASFTADEIKKAASTLFENKTMTTVILFPATATQPKGQKQDKWHE